MPVATFTVASDTDDGSGYKTGGSYPPTNSYVAEDGDICWAYKHLTNNEVDCGYFRWDTSSLPDTATITAAEFKPYVTAKSDVDGRNFVGDWYDFGGEPSVDADWTATPTGTAFSVTVASVSTLTVNTISLTDPDANINKSGYTGIRIAISGGVATGQNSVSCAAYENVDADLVPADLVVTYTVAAGGGGMMTVGVG